MAEPLILVTNDDGYRARGVRALARSLSTIAEVVVVAPDRERSGVGHAITLHDPLRLKQHGDGIWSVDGTPTDCTYMGLYHVLDRRPNLVCSGINHGPNLGDDALYSGTVGGAMEAALVGIPAMAISLCLQGRANFEAAADFGRRTAAFMLERDWHPRTLLNVNVPDLEGERVDDFAWTHGAVRRYGHTVEERRDGSGRPYFWIGGGTPSFQASDGCDAAVIERGLASITPLTMDVTHHGLLADLAVTDIAGLKRH